MLKENKPVLDEFNATKWHDGGFTGKGVTVVMIDSDGKPRPHMSGYYTDPLGTEKEHGHGTNIVEVIHEFAPNAKIVMLNKSNRDATFDWISKHKDQIDLINVSQAGRIGMPTPEYLRYEALGIPLICASGNDGYDDRISYPAAYDWTIAVGAWNWRDKGAANRDVAIYSNGGAKLDCVAPTGIYVKIGNESVMMDGTSFAAPSAVGMLACYIQWRKDNKLSKLSPEEARSFIRENCLDIREEGFDYASGHGLFKLPGVFPKIEPEKDIEEEVIELVKQYFSDVSPQNAAYGAIQSLKEKGIVGGHKDGTFKPNDNVTRRQMAVMLDGTINYIMKEIKKN